jgi:hypothetical protein
MGEDCVLETLTETQGEGILTPTHEQLWDWATPKRMQRLWSKIEKQSGEMACWNWTGAKQDGYGVMYLTIEGKKSPVLVHRLMLVMRSGKDYPAEYPVARHVVCRNRACCNPKHVQVGTHADNVQDTWNDAAVDQRGKKSRIPYIASIAVPGPVVGADIGPCGSVTTM